MSRRLAVLIVMSFFAVMPAFGQNEPVRPKKKITIQVVQTETKDALITQSSAFSFPSSIKPLYAKEAAQGSSTTVSVTKLDGLDTILNNQKVRLRCAQVLSPCHGLNAGQYDAELRGEDIWIVSYGMVWSKEQEKLVEKKYHEHWKAVGEWQ